MRESVGDMANGHRGRESRRCVRATALLLLLASATLAVAVDDLTNALPVGVTNAPALGITNAPAAKKAMDGREAAYDQIELFTEVMQLIRNNYVDEKTYEDIMQGALQGILQSLDPHSSYLPPDALGELEGETTGTYGGIGIYIGMKDGTLTVIAPIEGTPADRAGLQAGDRVLLIDGVKTVNMEVKDAVKRMRGPKGTSVTLTLLSTSDEKPRDVTIVRDDIEVPSVRGARILRDGIGYVRIVQFQLPTRGALQDALAKLTKDGMTALVLDLRNNPGGLLNSSVEIASLFLKKGQTIVTTRGRQGVHEEKIYRALGDVRYLDIPMVILINGGSASASEIVAGALQDHKRAVLVGDTTFGKWSVQSIVRLRSNTDAGVRMTTAHYYTPKDRKIDNGIDPDIPVPVSGAEWRKVLVRRSHVEDPDRFSAEDKKPDADVVDRQLERAVDLLQALKVFK